MVFSFDLILTCAGKSARFNSGSIGHIKKECALIDGKSVLSLALSPFLSFKELKNVVVTYPESEKEDVLNALEKVDLPEGVNLNYIQGGQSRTQSIKNAILFLDEAETTSSLIAIHDGARPFVTRALISSVLNNALKYGASLPALKLTDSIKTINGPFITSSVDRDKLVRVQTPQIFESKRIISIYKNMDNGLSFQDDAEPYVLYGGKCYVTEGEERNRKITYKEDLEEKKTMRVGFGNDIHRLENGRKFYLGGAYIPFEKGEVAHSDGDVLIHALIDALLGAKAKGDIGGFFPPEDKKWKDADSKELLKKILGSLSPEIVNIDAIITLENFKLAPYINEIRKSLSSLLKLDVSRISVKAKTNEGLDAIGEGKAVKAEVVVLVMD